MEIQRTSRSPVRQLAFLRKPISVLAALLAVAALTSLANAAPLVTNGSFELTTASTTTTFLFAGVSDWTNSDIGEALVQPSWFTNGYLFPGVGLAGPFPQTSPDGGNFVLSDGDYHHSPIWQTITGLTPGDSYQLTFYQALAQDTEPNVTVPGPVTGQWQVSLGASVQFSPLMSANGATPTISSWQSESMTFTAQNASEVLSFFSVGTGDPPMVGLDGISLVDTTPEPGAIWLMGLGAALFAWKLNSRRKAPAAHTRTAA